MASTLLGSEDETLTKPKGKAKATLLGAFGQGEGSGITERNADAIDTARGAGVSTNGTEFAKAALIGTAPIGITGPISTGIMGAMALSGNMSMPGNYNQNPGWNATFDKNLKQVMKDYPGMPGSFHGSIAAQRAKAEIDKQNANPDRGKAQGDKPAAAGATKGGGKANPGNTNF